MAASSVDDMLVSVSTPGHKTSSVGDAGFVLDCATARRRLSSVEMQNRKGTGTRVGREVGRGVMGTGALVTSWREEGCRVEMTVGDWLGEGAFVVVGGSGTTGGAVSAGIGAVMGGDTVGGVVGAATGGLTMGGGEDAGGDGLRGLEKAGSMLSLLSSSAGSSSSSAVNLSDDLLLLLLETGRLRILLFFDPLLFFFEEDENDTEEPLLLPLLLLELELIEEKGELLLLPLLEEEEDCGKGTPVKKKNRSHRAIRDQRGKERQRVI